jgi:hypothetical protein
MSRYMNLRVTAENLPGALKRRNSITARKLLIDFFSEKNERWKQEIGKLKT